MSEIRDATVDDIEAITEIHNALLTTTTIEWTDTPHTTDERRAWFEHKQAAGFPVVVAVDGGEVVGFATFGDFRDVARWPGYGTTVEHTVHVRESHWGVGVGRALVAELIERARERGKHVLVAGVDGENDASIRFHERLGFVEVARMPQVGAKFGRWLDLVLLQLRLDDRAQPGGAKNSSAMLSGSRNDSPEP